MKKFLRTVRITFTVWILAALINAVLVAVCIFFLEHLSKHLGLFFTMTIMYSLAFSIPGIFIFWLFFITSYYEEGLFQLLLKTAIFTSLGSYLLLVACFNNQFSGISYWPCISVVVAATASLMAHHKIICRIINENKL